MKIIPVLGEKRTVWNDYQIVMYICVGPRVVRYLWVYFKSQEDSENKYFVSTSIC